MRTFFHSKFYVQSGSMNLPQPVEKKSHHATGNFGVKITSLLLRRGEIYLQFCSKVFTSARDCQIAKQLLMSNASFERLNKNTVKLILLDGSEIHGTGTPPPPKFTSSLPKNLPGPNRKGLRVFTLPPFFRAFAVELRGEGIHLMKSCFVNGWIVSWLINSTLTMGCNPLQNWNKQGCFSCSSRFLPRNFGGCPVGS